MPYVPNQEPSLDPITNDGFFPDIDPAVFAEHVRLDDAISNDQKKSAILVAINRVNVSLRDYKATQIAAGYTTLAAVPAAQTDGKSVNVFDYLEAVFCSAKSIILDSYIDTDTTVLAATAAENKESASKPFNARVFEAIHRIIDGTRAQVELI